MNWGPAYWSTLRYAVETSSGAPLVAFVNAFALVLPCPKCIEHFKPILQQYPPEKYLASPSKEERLKWFDMVREAVRKQEPPMTPGRFMRRHRLALLVAALIAALLGLVAVTALCVYLTRRRPSM